MNSIMAIRDFMAGNSLTGDEVGNVRFEALVAYRSRAGNSTELTQVQITRNGYNDGDIEIRECGDLKTTDYHLGFTTQYQTYSFINGNLVINGNSPKMGGDYMVTISVSK